MLLPSLLTHKHIHSDCVYVWSVFASALASFNEWQDSFKTHYTVILWSVYIYIVYVWAGDGERMWNEMASVFDRLAKVPLRRPNCRLCETLSV